MPYIKQEQRAGFGQILENLKPANAGDLNYIITKLAHKYIADKGLRYRTRFLL